MFIYQNGKLYVQDGDTLVGVEIHPDKIIKVEDEVATLSKSAMYLTLDEVIRKFQIRLGNSVTFDKKVAEVVEVEEVIGEEKNVTTDDVKKPTRKSTRK